MVERMTAAEFRRQPKPKGRSKFNAKRVEIDGFTFDSKAEAKRYGELKALERGGKIACLTVHPSFSVVINSIKVFVWTADFSYREVTNGPRLVSSLIVEDVKSEGTRREREWKLKKRVVEAAYGITITEVVR